MLYTQEHLELQRSVKKFIESEINPHVDVWEEAEIFPAHELFKKMGDAPTDRDPRQTGPAWASSCS